MQRITIVSLFLILLFTSACDEAAKQGSSPIEKSGTPVVYPTDDKIPDDLIIRLKRSMCYGSCPAYMLTVKADGQVNFFGQHYTETKGQAKGEISKDKIRKLIAEFKKIDFFSLKNSYTKEDCATDSPRVNTTLFINGKVKKIDHDTGCKAPKELTALEDKIDEIVGTKKWIGNPDTSKHPKE